MDFQLGLQSEGAAVGASGVAAWGVSQWMDYKLEPDYREKKNVTVTAIATDPLFSVLPVLSLAKEHLVRLATQTAACVHQRGFLEDELCGALAQSVDAMPLEAVNQERVSPPVLRYGPTLNDYVAKGRLNPDYWAHVERARAAWADAGLAHDPLRACLDRIEAAWGSRAVPARIEGREVLAGTIRESDGGLRVHFDDVSREFPRGVFDQQITAQLAINVYLSVPRTGGETTVWRRTWDPADEHARIGFGYDRRLVDRVQSVIVRPKPGDALIFNPRFYHAVGAGQNGRRVSVAMFLGLSTDGTLVAWS